MHAARHDRVAGARATDEVGRPLLDEATHSVPAPHATPRGAWAVALHEAAGEGSICWSLPRPSEERDATDSDGERPPAADPERAALEAARRARSTLRRYCVALGIDRLGTATFRCRRCDLVGCECIEGPDRPKHDEFDYVLACIESFRRAVMAEFGKTPLVVVIEEHDDGHLHVHFGFARYLDREKLRRCWPHGFVDLRRLQVGKGQHVGQRERARRVAAYLAKYVTKQAGHGRYRKRYSTTRGLVGGPRRSRFMTKQEAERWLLSMVGFGPSFVWSSEDVPTWEAPPVMVLFFGDPPDG